MQYRMKSRGLLTILVVFLVVIFLTPLALQTVQAEETQEEQNLDEPSNLNIFQALAIQQTIESAKAGVEMFSGTLDTFVGFTPYVEGSEIKLDVQSTGEKKEKTITNTDFLRKPFLLISISILAILIAVEGIQYITSDERDPKHFKDSLKNYIVTASLLIISPFIFNLSTRICNEFNQQLLGDQKISVFIIDFFDDLSAEVDLSNIEVDTSDNEDVSDWIKDIFDWGSKESVQQMPEEFQKQLSVLGYVQAMPYMIPIALMFLFFLFIAFQFIIRFVSLYFLTVIYPLIIPFYLHRGSRQMVQSFFKVWITTLVHQPAFILGYVLIANLLKSIVTEGATFNSLLIFVGFLIFLTGINVFMGRIVGDAWSALSQTALAGIGTAILGKGVGSVKDKTTGISTSAKRGALGGQVTDVASYVGRNIGTKLGLTPPRGGGLTDTGTKAGKDLAEGVVVGGAKLGTTAKGRAPYGKMFSGKKDMDPTKIHKVKFGKELADAGLDVSPIDPNWGVNNVKGEFWSSREADGSGMYANFKSKEDAIEAGYKESEVSKVTTGDGGINYVDPSNMKARGRFNSDITKIVKNQGITQGKRKNATKFSDDAPSPDRIGNIFKHAGKNIKSKGIGGIASKRRVNPSGRRSGKNPTLVIYTDQRLNET